MDLLGVVAVFDHDLTVGLKVAKVVLIQTATVAVGVRIKVHLNQSMKTSIQCSQSPLAGLYLGAERRSAKVNATRQNINAGFLK